MKVFIAIMAVHRIIHTYTAKTLLVMGADPRVEVEFFFVQHVPLDAARNKVIDTFIDSGADYLISIDDDVGCDKNPIDLCFLKKDVIFLPTPIIQEGETKLNVHYLTKDSQLREIAKAGTGCFVLSRKAALTIEKPCFKFLLNRKGQCTLGEDFYFCKKASKHFTLYTHNDYPCHHVKSVDLLSLGKRTLNP